MKTEKEKLALAELADTLSRIEKAANLLSNSYRKCKAIGIKNDYSDPELEVFDAFTSRFARVSDMLTHRVFKLIDLLEFEGSSTFIDSINRAEKRGIITSIIDFKEIREIRNEIAHEYALREYSVFAEHILHLTPILLSSIEKVIDYSKNLEISREK